MKDYTSCLEEIGAQDFQEFGGKGANLGELTKSGFNVPTGFCIRGYAYHYFLMSNNISNPIAKIAAGTNFSDINELDQKTDAIRRLIIQAHIPEDLDNEIRTQYRKLQSQKGRCYVAVRSSVSVSGTSISSFPGMLNTYHYVGDEAQLMFSIKSCWASLWTTRAAADRHRRSINHSKGIIAPVVQQMVVAEVAGVTFTLNPMPLSEDEMLIQSNWGLGESVVCGMYPTDTFILDRRTLSLKQSDIERKIEMITCDWDKGYGTKTVAVEDEKIDIPTLKEDQLKELSVSGLKIEDHFGTPQDIEWAYDKDRLYILQARKAR